MIVEIPCMDSDFKLEIVDYKNSKSTTGKQLRVWNVKADGTESKSHYIPLEVLPDYLKGIAELLIKEKNT